VNVVVQGGKVVGGPKTHDVPLDNRVILTVKSDVADEVHVHGYDLKQDVPAGGSVRFNFAADIEGVFEIELEERKEQIAELRVSPS
jgi:heme/copper-type cytochrome/quinol oxidase subunit 2